MSQRLRVGWMVDTLSCDTAGTERQILGMLERLDRTRFEPTLFALRSSPWLEMNTLPCPTRTFSYRGFLKLSFPAVVASVRRAIDEEACDIVHAFFDESIFVAALALRRSRARPALLASRRDLGLGAEKPWYHAVFPAIRRRIERSCAGVVVNAEAIRRHLVDVDRIPESVIQVVPNGVAVPPQSAPPPGLLVHTPSDTIWAMIAANLKPVKRIDTVIRALAIIRLRAPQVQLRLAILGDGEQRHALQELARSLDVADRVHLVGTVPRATDWLQHGHIGVLSSEREGLSNAILEYLSCGLPVAATDVGGNSELVDDDCGVLVKPGDAEALAHAILPWLRDESLRRAKGRAALEKVRKRFSWERTMTALERFYNEIGTRTANSGS